MKNEQAPGKVFPRSAGSTPAREAGSLESSCWDMSKDLKEQGYILWANPNSYASDWLLPGETPPDGYVLAED